MLWVQEILIKIYTTIFELKQ